MRALNIDLCMNIRLINRKSERVNQSFNKEIRQGKPFLFLPRSLAFGSQVVYFKVDYLRTNKVEFCSIAHPSIIYIDHQCLKHLKFPVVHTISAHIINFVKVITKFFKMKPQSSLWRYGVTYHKALIWVQPRA